MIWAQSDKRNIEITNIKKRKHTEWIKHFFKISSCFQPGIQAKSNSKRSRHLKRYLRHREAWSKDKPGLNFLTPPLPLKAASGLPLLRAPPAYMATRTATRSRKAEGEQNGRMRGQKEEKGGIGKTRNPRASKRGKVGKGGGVSNIYRRPKPI